MYIVDESKRITDGDLTGALTQAKYEVIFTLLPPTEMARFYTLEFYFNEKLDRVTTKQLVKLSSHFKATSTQPISINSKFLGNEYNVYCDVAGSKSN